jgi:hypothetical protein
MGAGMEKAFEEAPRERETAVRGGQKAIEWRVDSQGTLEEEEEEEEQGEEEEDQEEHEEDYAGSQGESDAEDQRYWETERGNTSATDVSGHLGQVSVEFMCIRILE